ncbi:MAG TPA: DJ-1/PfpI family protein [Victivallales bacterium]|nr:DJ-1/PfpI family protein [Victivallales bacterium]
MNKKIALMLAEGFEEIEVVVPIDVLRRLEFNLVIAGEKDLVRGSHGLEIKCDSRINSIRSEDFDCIILPGGMPGSLNLMNNKNVINIVKEMNKNKKLICAICAAPIALSQAGVIKGVKITSHPSVKDKLSESNYSGSNVEQDANIITGKGPGVSFEFTCRIAQALGKKRESEELMKDMFVG